MVTDKRLSRILRLIATGGEGEIQKNDPVTLQMLQAVTAARRLGLDYRALAGNAVDIVTGIEREHEQLSGEKWTECTRILAIFSFTLAVRLYLGGSVFEDVGGIIMPLIGFVVLISVLSIVMGDSSEVNLGSRTAIAEILRSLLVAGQGRENPAPLAAKLKFVRRQEMLTGVDGGPEREMIFLDELGKRFIALSDHHRRLRGVFPVYEIGFACVEFMIFDVDPLLKLVEHGVNF
jgi:hypothetical protein